MSRDFIKIRGAKQHNLKDISIDIPLESVVCITGVSGSGKSTLAFDTIYAEGQRRYCETFSPYARQFMERMDRPNVERIEGIPPAIAIQGTNPVKSSRSTVGTITEIADYLKLLFSKIAILHCKGCNREVKKYSPHDIWNEILRYPEGTQVIISFPYFPNGLPMNDLKGKILGLGFHRVIVNREVIPIDSLEKIDGDYINVVVDRFFLRREERSRIVDSLEMAFLFGRGHLSLLIGEDILQFTSRLNCPYCKIDYKDPLPNLFSFNSPVGACDECKGFGKKIDIDMDLVVPDPSKTIAGGAIQPWTLPAAEWEREELIEFCKKESIPVNRPFRELKEDQKRAILEGKRGYYGVRGWFRWLESKAYKTHVRVFLSRYRRYIPCKACGGTRFKPEALLYRFRGKNIGEILSMTIGEAHDFFKGISLTHFEEGVARQIFEEIKRRLQYLMDVGLEYLSLDRQSRTLSGGEVERVNLTTALGSSLVNTLFVLDEPSIGLHPRDNHRLIRIIKGLKRNHNTVIIVEHDPDIIREADLILDLGPGPGEMGGEVIYFGKGEDIGDEPRSLTGAYLKGNRVIPLPKQRRRPKKGLEIRIRGACANNLKFIDVTIPLQVFVCITGVSGSGKSTLVEEVLYKGIKRAKMGSGDIPQVFKGIEGHELISDVILVDQQPIGNTPRANPITYLKAFDPIRVLFSRTKEARNRGFGPGHFSFNVPGGRCERCHGEGFEKVEMQFLSDIFIQCPECNGKRFKGDVLECLFREKSIADVLQMTASEAAIFFSDFPKIRKGIEPMIQVGLGYLRLGQPINTLSGGETQRLKLAKYLNIKNGNCLFILDEPTTGLHLSDTERLLNVIQALIDEGHSIVIIEHNMEVVKCADYVIDLGPEGGDRGGEIVAMGTPEEVALCPSSHTGRYLKMVMEGHNRGMVKKDEEEIRTDSDHSIMICGARQHNLKGIDLRIPRDKFVVITGVSGSGKSTLAYDIIFAEGQRRYLDSLSTYVRQYLKVMERPDCDYISGIPPTVAIDQRSSQGQKRSTVATVTEIYHYLRLLYSKIGIQYCIHCGEKIIPWTREGILNDIRERFSGQKIRFWAPKVMERKGFHRDILDRARKKGYRLVKVDGMEVDLAEVLTLSRYKEHQIELLICEIDLYFPTGDYDLSALIEKSISEGKGTFYVESSSGERFTYSLMRFCPRCKIGIDELDPRLFSFNSKIGACPECEGRGLISDFDDDLILKNDTTPLGKGIRPISSNSSIPFDGGRLFRDIERILGIPPNRPLSEISDEERRFILYGKGPFEGVIPRLRRLLENTDQERVINHLVSFMVERKCPVCEGQRLNKKALSVRIKGLRISDMVAMTVKEAINYWSEISFSGRESVIAHGIVEEIKVRLRFLEEVGLSYLRLDRSTDTLSGGEAQRIRLAAQLGSNLRGVCYILDEPTIGLHPWDHMRLLNTLFKLKERGNSIIVVEHDEETIRRGDYIIDLGPGAGEYGGKVVAAGTLEEIIKNPLSVTGQFLNGRYLSKYPRGINSRFRVAKDGKWLKVIGAKEHNLKGLDVSIPIGTFTCITGVSGSGKSTLVHDIIYKGMKSLITGQPLRPGAHKAIEGWEEIERVLEVDHSPIGRTPRSIPGSYVGFLDEIRRVFASVPEARAKGYRPGRFSFNVKGGRCEACGGQGTIRMEMSFLPDVYVTCEACGGKRFNEETLSCKYRGKTIADCLSMTIDEASEFFKNIPKARRSLETLRQIGLGYLRIGQPSPTLSGGEAQRIKLAYELSRPSNGKNLYILDEPTTGLHMADIERLIDCFQNIVDRGDTLIVIEHNLDVIRSADYIIDLGPGGGEDGGEIVAQGNPLEIVKEFHHSRTAQSLRQYLKMD
jgi:excinuclease ABC subunit A